MKKKLIEKTTPIKTRHKGWWITAQIVDGILVLNVWDNGRLNARHAIDTRINEYATLKNGNWSDSKVESAINMPYEVYGDQYWHGGTYEKLEKERFCMSKEDQSLIESYLPEKLRYRKYSPLELISGCESDLGRKQRENRETRRWNRVQALMEEVPEVPEDIREWVHETCFQGEDYCLLDKDSGKWSCSACGRSIVDKGTQKIRHNDLLTCPECGKKIILKKRNGTIKRVEHFCVIQPIDEKKAVARHFETVYLGEPGKKRELIIQEQIRIVLLKDQNKKECDIYYMQYGYSCYLTEESNYIPGDFDNKGNRSNRRTYVGHLYDGGIKEAFENTAYEPWNRMFTEWAAAGMKMDYNWMMTAYDEFCYQEVMEMLWRGRFYRLLIEESERISHWYHTYTGSLHLDGSSIEDVFGIKDRQMINRIRDKNGGNLMLDWMRWSERHKSKISEKAMEWLRKNGLYPSELRWINCRFTVEQAMNYFERQRRESYKDQKIRQIISQYEDYMDMCKKLHKNTSDEMVYKPRELKRRHDECVAAVERQRAQLKTEEYSKKFGKAEKVLGMIREKFEFTGEEYFIMVPKRIVDIVAEGNFLHHCAGATDRYFDRIKQHETYICFLRKVTEPDTPFYTIEVEPGGTIRQHRGMYDEEPDIDKVKPFLREWQKEIRSRMRKEDHELAAVSKEKREANIEELKAKNNTRVLQGLMEDFMEAAGL